MILGATWPYITPEYMVRDMTWNEIGAALEYVYRYVEPQPASASGKKYKTMSDYTVKGRDTLRDDLRKMRRTIGKG